MHAQWQIPFFDIIILGAGWAGLFCSIHAPKSAKKLILEKNKNPGVKVLLSGGERANVSNRDIEPERDYFGQNTKALLSLFSHFSNLDAIDFFENNWVHIVEEDRRRLILESGDSRELLALLVKKAGENNTQIVCNAPAEKIEKKDDTFFVSAGEKQYSCKKLVVATGGKSFSQVGTTGDGYTFAEHFGIPIIPPHRGLCGLVTQKDMSELSGVSLDLQIHLIAKGVKKPIYSEYGPLLFTHFGVSGPIIFNTAVALWEYMNTKQIRSLLETEWYTSLSHDEKVSLFVRESVSLELDFSKSTIIPKRVHAFFSLSDMVQKILLPLQDYRTWKEAKITGGWIPIDVLKDTLESKTVPGLFFAGEVIDITGKTGGFNLQFAWSSGYRVGKSL